MRLQRQPQQQRRQVGHRLQAHPAQSRAQRTGRCDKGKRRCVERGLQRLYLPVKSLLAVTCLQQY
jgi:hypothetical protein